ncbi:SusE domain-containing protein [Paraflavitalea pollutisoli]|uniref:SusE domain-containing protein n=1 Tax=Paraflavitalea pollutisoli TaxID=3034143 RepID=UPI0023EDF0D4|nr:SusE domain-containing protein [Paraflavitalea sp. H1-2-19X]
MRTIVHYLLIIAASCCLFACQKDGEDYQLRPGSFGGNALSASSTTVVLTAAKENDTALRFQWSAADFGVQPVISYVLQLGRVSDTANSWATAKSITIDANRQQYAFVTKDLNNLLNGMGITPGVANTIAVRIRANVNQYNGAASTVPPVFTNTVSPQITSYGLDLYVPGDYQGWSPATAPKLAPVAGRAGLYEGYVYMAGAGQHYFKYTNAPDWNHTNYGDGGSGSFNTDGAAAGLSVPDGGYYYLTANLNNNTWTATKTTWGMLGDASPGGWDTDTQLSYDEAAQVWKVTANMKKNGSFKFRANKAWDLDLGVDGAGKLQYADNPFLGYTAGLNNLTVPEDGNYSITLDLHVAGNYTYVLHKN